MFGFAEGFAGMFKFSKASFRCLFVDDDGLTGLFKLKLGPGFCCGAGAGRG